MKQAQATAVNVLGGDILLTAETPVTMLKGVGLELFTVGRTVTPVTMTPRFLSVVVVAIDVSLAHAAHSAHRSPGKH